MKDYLPHKISTILFIVSCSLFSCTPEVEFVPTNIVTSTIFTVPVNEPTSTFIPVFSDCGGKTISFASNRDGNNEIYAMNSDGTNTRNLTQNPAEDIQPFYSPDGKYIAFWSDLSGDIYFQDVFIMNSDGVNVINLTNQSIKLKGGSYIYWSLDAPKIGTLRTLSEGIIFTIDLKKLKS